MKVEQRSLLINLGWLLIFTLVFSGLLMDGPQFADMLCPVALYMWLWLRRAPDSTPVSGTGPAVKPDREFRQRPLVSINPKRGASHIRSKP